ncbi:helix-turn-helix domain-containing protein [Microbacterium arabinogalactanolyticum]|uniref:helix-turn-helix domain-containing protein n=1 Tax=Microbacterium arabinogalactanolyticum TaxID=69365 RepID=UPI004044509A
MTAHPTSQDRPTETFAQVLSTAIRERGITLSRLHARLSERGNPVSRATLSYWRSGERRPEGAQSLAAIGDLEEMLDLDPGTLLDRLGPTMRTGPLGSTAFPFDEDPTEQRVRETFLAMGAAYPDPTRELTIHAVTDVGPDGRVRRRTTRMVVQATSGVVSAIPFVEITTGEPTPQPGFEALGGGRISVRHTHPSSEVHGFMFELDRPITSPETTMIEWAVKYPDEFPITDGTGHGVAFQSRELLLWTRFDPAWVPDWCEELEETPAGLTVTPRALDGALSLHAIRRGFGPGALSIRWGHGERPDAG